MTAFQPAPGIAALVIAASGADNPDPAQNVFHFRKNDLTPWGTTDLLNLVDSFDTWLGTAHGIAAFITPMHTGMSIVQLTGRDLSTDGGPVVERSVAHVGTDTGEALASGLSFAITLRTGLAGRSFRGRAFKFGMTDTANSGVGPDQVTTSWAGAIVDGLTYLVSAAEGWSPAMKWVVVSRRHKVGGTPNVLRDSAIGTPVTTCGFADLNVDFQRRRAPGHSRHN